MNTVKLYTLKHRDRFKIATTSANGFVKDNLDNEVILEFLNLDGMYARCSFHGNYEYILGQTDVVLI